MEDFGALGIWTVADLRALATSFVEATVAREPALARELEHPMFQLGRYFGGFQPLHTRRSPSSLEGLDAWVGDVDDLDVVARAACLPVQICHDQTSSRTGGPKHHGYPGQEL